MNIFVLDENPYKAAEYLDDTRVIKMILESAQMLSTAHRVLDGTKVVSHTTGRKKTIWCLSGCRESILYKATHINHPCNVWIRESSFNYDWLLHHMIGLIGEYSRRYGKIHKSSELLPYVKRLPKNIIYHEPTPHPLAMPERFFHHDPIIAYRHYFNEEKLFPKNKPASWRTREIPFWIEKSKLKRVQ